MDWVEEIENYGDKLSLRGLQYTTKLPPYAHQAKAVELMWDRTEFALLMAMRTGKTKTTLDDFGHKFVRDLVDDLLIVAPAGVYRTWVGAIQEHVGPPLDENRLRVHVWSAAQTGKGALRALDSFLNASAVSDRPRALIINVEALSSVKRAKEVALKFAGQRRCYGVIDESTAIKNVFSKRAQFCALELAPKLAFRRILSGLISPQSPLDVYAQFAFLKPGLLGHTNYTTFKARYAIMDFQYVPGKADKDGVVRPRKVEHVVGYRFEDELHELMAPHSFRVRLEDCYDMKDPTYGFREVELTEEQERLYHELREYSTAELESQDYVTATIAMVKVLKLHQILCGFVTDENGELHSIEENRTKEVLRALSEYDGKAIIWCAYDPAIRKMAAMLQEAYGEGSVARFWGGNRATREEEEARFKADPRCRFMVATAAAGGRGRTWNMADLTIYHSNNSNLEHRSQSEERTKGVGKVKPVAYLDLKAVTSKGEETVDLKIIESLRKKWNMADILQGDGWREWLI